MSERWEFYEGVLTLLLVFLGSVVLYCIFVNLHLRFKWCIGSKEKARVFELRSIESFQWTSF